MGDVFSQIYIQTVFAVKNRQALIQPEWEERLYQFDFFFAGLILT